MDDARQFWKAWPRCVDAIGRLYGERMPLPDERFTPFVPQLPSIRSTQSIGDVERFLSGVHDFDGRFCGAAFGYDPGGYEWAVYSLCYLARRAEMIDLILAAHVPLLRSRFVFDALGGTFRVKLGVTFMEAVGHYLWDVQGLDEAEDHGLFDWHANRNRLAPSKIHASLGFAGLPPLPHPDFPPRWVLLHCTNLQDPFDSEEHYLRDLEAFYRKRGYRVRPNRRCEE